MNDMINASVNIDDGSEVTFPKYLFINMIIHDYDIFCMDLASIDDCLQEVMTRYYNGLHLKQFKTSLLHYEDVNDEICYRSEQDVMGFRSQLLAYIDGTEVINDLRDVRSQHLYHAANDDNYESAMGTDNNTGPSYLWRLFAGLKNWATINPRQKTDFIEIVELKSNSRGLFSLIFKTSKGKFHVKIRRHSRGNYTYTFDVLMWDNDVDEGERERVLEKNHGGKLRFSNREKFTSSPNHSVFFKFYLKSCNISPKVFEKGYEKKRDYRRRKFISRLPVL